MTKKHKKFCTSLNYIEHFLILAFKIAGCIPISAFTSLIGIPIALTSSSIGLKISEIAAGIIKYKSIIKKKRKKHDTIVLLAIYKLNSVEVLISKALIDSGISHDEFVLINNVLKEYGETKEERYVWDTLCLWWHNKTKYIDNLKLKIKQCYRIASSLEKIQKVQFQKLQGQKKKKKMLLSKCAACNSKKLSFIRQQEASPLLSSLRINTTLNKNPLLGPLLFWRY